jgi:mono/diheme cytochrome c family protein
VKRAPLPAARALTAAAALAGICALAGAGSVAWATDAAGEETLQLTDGPGRDLASQRCAICHSLDYIPSSAPAMDRAAWQKTIQKMRERFGAPVTDDEARQILEYLAGNYSGKS